MALGAPMPPLPARNAANPLPAGGAGAGAGARPRVFTGLIHPSLLEEVSDDFTCVVCLGVLVEPASGGCPNGGANACPPVCSACWVTEIRDVGECPTCGHGVTDQSQLQQIGYLQSIVSNLRMRCKHAARSVQAKP